MAHKSALINVMDAAARKAARRLVRDFGEVEQLQVSAMGPSAFVAAADRKAEETLQYELRQVRADYGFLLETAGEVKGKDLSNRWIVDPLNGAANFLNGLPHFAISIALERDSEIFAGVIYDPTRDEMFYAEKGQGAFVNDRRLRASGRNRTIDAVVACGMPQQAQGRAGRLAQYSRELTALTPNVAGVRQSGAAALDIAYVAAGRYDAYWARGLSPWDIAAGMIIAREAGAMVSETDLGARMLKTGSILVANGSLHDPMAALLREARGSA